MPELSDTDDSTSAGSESMYSESGSLRDIASPRGSSTDESCLEAPPLREPADSEDDADDQCPQDFPDDDDCEDDQGMREYYDFLREMGCDFENTPDDDEDQESITTESEEESESIEVEEDYIAGAANDGQSKTSNQVTSSGPIKVNENYIAVQRNSACANEALFEAQQILIAEHKAVESCHMVEWDHVSYNHFDDAIPSVFVMAKEPTSIT